MFPELVVIRGGGDLGSGVAVRLHRSGFPVVILECDRPLAVRRSVAFSEAVYDGETAVEGIKAVRVNVAAEAHAVASAAAIPLLVDPGASSLHLLSPAVLVDAIVAKRNLGTCRGMAPLVLALGPGFRAGTDVDAVIETNRGPNLGRVIWVGGAEANTGRPGEVAGRSVSRVLRAPADGRLDVNTDIGAIVEEGEEIGSVAGKQVAAPFAGLVRGLLRDGTRVSAGMKIGDLDPRLDPELTRLVSDKALAVAGGVLEAVLSHLYGPGSERA